MYKIGTKIVGFIGIKIDRQLLQGQNYLMIQFGQAVIDRTYRGMSFLPVTITKLFAIFWRDFLFGHTYFWAEVLTYNSYLAFAKPLPFFYPSYRHPTPYEIKEMIDSVGSKQFRAKYNPVLGTICNPFNVVNDFSTEIQTKYLEDKDINFFTSINARHEEGHGLITIAPANTRNLYSILKRYVMKYLLPHFWFPRMSLKKEKPKNQLIPIEKKVNPFDCNVLR